MKFFDSHLRHQSQLWEERGFQPVAKQGIQELCLCLFDASKVLEPLHRASTCNQVPLRLGNQTMNIIWVDCLQALAQQQTQ